METQTAIHSDGILHDWFDSIKTHAAIADPASFGNEMFSNGTAQASTPECGNKVEALHFADVGFEFAERDAAGELTLEFRQEQPAARRGVLSGQCGEFLIEILETQTEPERVGIIKEELPDARNLGR